MSALEAAMKDAVASGIRFDFVETNGLRMHYARKGRGRPLVLLHGWPEFWMVFRPLMERLEDQFELIVPDLRGCGFTGKPFAGPDVGANADAHAQDIKGLLDALGFDRVGMVGGDLGAYVLQAFAQHFPARLDRAFFFCTPYPGLGSRYGAPDHLIEVWYQYFQQLPWAAALVGASRHSCKLYLSHFLDHWSGDNPDIFKDMIEIYTDMFMMNDNIQGGFDWYLSSARNRRKWLEGTLPKPPLIQVPTRFLWGGAIRLLRSTGATSSASISRTIRSASRMLGISFITKRLTNAPRKYARSSPIRTGLARSTRRMQRSCCGDDSCAALTDLWSHVPCRHHLP